MLVTICADGTALAPGFIYQGTTYDLQDTWLEDYDHSSAEAYFVASLKGWINKELGLSWLKKIFEASTRSKANNNKRLFIVDGHSSHLNMKFIDYCDAHAIILAILFSHSTHRLQPLNVTIFSFLATAYSNQIDSHIQSSQGFSRVTKRVFWSLFRNAWHSALTVSNIHAGFSATGIWPLDSSKVLRQFEIHTPSPSPSNTESRRKTPKSIRGIRRAIKAVRAEDPAPNALDDIIRAAEKLSITADIQAHKLKGLREALVDEKRRRKRGKAMDLFAKDKPGQAMFLSPDRIATIRARQEQLETEREQVRLAKEQEKKRKVIERELKAQEVRERKEARQAAAAEKRAAKIHAKETRIAQKQANQQLAYEQSIPHTPTKPIARLNKRKAGVDPPSMPPSLKTKIGRNGRGIALPTRFRN